MHVATTNAFQGTGRRDRRGVAVLIVLAVIAITLALAYGLSRSSSTMAQISAHEGFGRDARAAVDMSVGPTIINLRTNPAWMPTSSPTSGSLDSGETYQVGVQIADEGAERQIDASAQVFDDNDASRPLAEQHLTINLTRQTRSDWPTSAIAAFATRTSLTFGPPVYIASGNTVRGNVRSRGPIQFQAGFVLQGTPYQMGTIARTGTGTSGYLTYQASWGTSYKASYLNDHGVVDSTGTLSLDNVVLGPTAENPMGVYHYKGTQVVLGDNVQINGTVVVRGNLKIVGTGVHLIAAQPTAPTADAVPADDLPPGHGGLIAGNGNAFGVGKGGGLIEPVDIVPVEVEPTVSKSFPAAVVDGTITIEETADVVRVSGVLVASYWVKRIQGTTANLSCNHDHSLSIDEIINPLGSTDGPAIYIRGTIMATRVSLQHRSDRPLALVFDPAVTDVSTAPGFFTWRVSDWTESD
jgi:hypothetical protein